MANCSTMHYGRSNNGTHYSGLSAVYVRELTQTDGNRTTSYSESSFIVTFYVWIWAAWVTVPNRVSSAVHSPNVSTHTRMCCMGGDAIWYCNSCCSYPNEYLECSMSTCIIFEISHNCYLNLAVARHLGIHYFRCLTRGLNLEVIRMVENDPSHSTCVESDKVTTLK